MQHIKLRMGKVSTDLGFAFFKVYDPSKCGVFPSLFPLGEAWGFYGRAVF